MPVPESLGRSDEIVTCAEASSWPPPAVECPLLDQNVPLRMHAPNATGPIKMQKKHSGSGYDAGQPADNSNVTMFRPKQAHNSAMANTCTWQDHCMQTRAVISG